MPRIGGVAAAVARAGSRRAEEARSKARRQAQRNTNEGPSEDHLQKHPHPKLLQPSDVSGARIGFAALDDDNEEFYDAHDGAVPLANHSFLAKKHKSWYQNHWFPKPLRKVCRTVVENEPFQLAIVVLIAINAIMLGIATFSFVEDNPLTNSVFEWFDFAFLVIFSIELGLQFIYRDVRIFSDGWLTFDFVIIILSWTFAQMQVIRAFRIFRALRLISRIQTMRNLVEALLSVMPKMACIGALLGLVFYIFAVMFTNLFQFSYQDGFTSYDYFSTLDAALFTLFQIMTMDNWAEICRECMNQYIWAWCPFVIFVVASGFVVVNLIIAVICDSISALNDIADRGSNDTSKMGSDGVKSNANPLKQQLQQDIDDLTVMLEQMQASQYQGRSVLERLTVQLRDVGVVQVDGLS